MGTYLIEFLPNGTNLYIPDIHNTEAREAVCATLTEEECGRWVQCCEAAEKCCKNMMEDEEKEEEEERMRRNEEQNGSNYSKVRVC